MVAGVMYEVEQARRHFFEELERYESGGSISGIPPTFAPFFYVPELDMLAQVFPYDYRLPALSALMAGPLPELEHLLLSRFGPGDWRTEAWEAGPLRYRATLRATLRLIVRARDNATAQTEERRYYAKLSREEEEGEQTYQVLRQLWDGAGMKGETFTVARPIAYLSGLRTFLQEEASGTSLHEMLLREEDAVWAIRKVARALATLHLSDVVAPRSHHLNNEIALLRGARDNLRSASPHLAPEVEEIFDAVVAGLEEVPPSPTHGDLKPVHLLFNDGRFTLIDLDTFAGADPVRDVAHFSFTVARTMSPRFFFPSDRARTVTQAFVEEYFAHVPEAWRSRLPFHYAGTALKKAAASMRRRRPGRSDVVESLLNEARDSLAGKIW